MIRVVAVAFLLLLQSADDLSRRRDALSARIEELRREKFAGPVSVGLGTRKEGASLALDHAKDLYGGDLAGFERVFKALGLLPTALKLHLAIPTFASASMKSYVQAGALKVLDPALPDDEFVYRLALVLSERKLKDAPASGGSFDARMARLAVQHGEADMTKQLFWAGLRVDGVRGDGAEHLRKLVEGADKWERETSGFAGLVAPRFLVRSSDFMWRRGGIFMETMRQAGGSARLRYVYRQPPETTEQILHPEKFLAGERPSALDLSPLDAWFTKRGSGSVFRTSLGELGTALLLESLESKTKPEASAGWAADRLLAWAEGDRTLIVWATAWDEEKDAKEFEDAAAAAGFVINGRDESAKAAVIRRGRSAAFIMNCPDAIRTEVLDALWKGTRTTDGVSKPFGS